MIAWLRSVFFNIFLIVWTILVATFFFPIIWMKPRIVANVSYVWATGTMAAMRVILGIKVVYKGEGYLPEEPFILACKHQSAIDTIAFLTYLKYPVYILKKELVYIPFFGWYLPAMGMVAINRKAGASALKDMVRQVKQRLSEKRSVIIFPEGTRVLPGDKNPYQPGIAAIYSQCDVPVIPVALDTGTCWPKNAFTKHPGTVTIEFLPPLNPGKKKTAFMGELESAVENASSALLKKRA